VGRTTRSTVFPLIRPIFSLDAFAAAAPLTTLSTTFCVYADSREPRPMGLISIEAGKAITIRTVPKIHQARVAALPSGDERGHQPQYDEKQIHLTG
jgi:hypothetical protein